MAAKKPVAKKVTKKTTAKKTTTKKPAAKAAAKKPAARKTSAQPRTKTTTTQTPKARLPIRASGIAARRPPNNPPMSQQQLDVFANEFNFLRDELEDYAAHLRSLDRKRLNGIGLKKRGFVEAALALAIENPLFLPHWLTIDKFEADNAYFVNLRAMFDVVRQIQELLWNIIIEASDVLYTDALEFYASVREASARRVDAAESIFSELSVFFKSRGSSGREEPTVKKTKRDFDALMHGKKDGKIIVENVKPKLSGGTHKVIDKTFKDTARFKDTEEGTFED